MTRQRSLATAVLVAALTLAGALDAQDDSKSRRGVESSLVAPSHETELGSLVAGQIRDKYDTFSSVLARAGIAVECRPSNFTSLGPDAVGDLKRGDLLTNPRRVQYDLAVTNEGTVETESGSKTAVRVSMNRVESDDPQHPEEPASILVKRIEARYAGDGLKTFLLTSFDVSCTTVEGPLDYRAIVWLMASPDMQGMPHMKFQDPVFDVLGVTRLAQ